jgi:hypothetical protein
MSECSHPPIETLKTVMCHTCGVFKLDGVRQADVEIWPPSKPEAIVLDELRQEWEAAELNAVVGTGIISLDSLRWRYAIRLLQFLGNRLFEAKLKGLF